MPDEYDDFQRLMRRVREGSEEAAWELVRRYGEPIRRAVRRTLNQRMRSKFDSLDFVQIVWASFFRCRAHLERFDRPEQLAAFLATMSRNKVGIEARRRLSTKKYGVARETSLDGRHAGQEARLSDRRPGPVEMAVARERWDRLLADQPEQYRQIIQLRLQGHTYDDIADCLHVAKSTVRRFLHRLFHDKAT